MHCPIKKTISIRASNNGIPGISILHTGHSQMCDKVKIVSSKTSKRLSLCTTLAVIDTSFRARVYWRQVPAQNSEVISLLLI